MSRAAASGLCGAVLLGKTWHPKGKATCCLLFSVLFSHSTCFNLKVNLKNRHFICHVDKIPGQLIQVFWENFQAVFLLQKLPFYYLKQHSKGNLAKSLCCEIARIGKSKL